jgi:DNA helicase HerA-like ATPase
MIEEKYITLGANESAEQVQLLARLANRHGLVTGATGTGKTVTLQVLAEGFSRLGISVFAADVKGDLSGLAAAGSEHPKISERVEKIGLSDFAFNPRPVVFWDLYGKSGHPVRATIGDLGPQLLSNLMELNETQEGVLQIAFKVAEVEKMPLVDLKDLKSLLSWIEDRKKEISNEYGNVSAASVGAIQRRLLVLEESGGNEFFGEPALSIEHLMQVDFSGNGVISLLDAKELMLNPRAYATFLLWLLTKLFSKLPEVGDQPLPKLVFFFDEAHLLFENAPKALVERIEQIVRLIRSKGVGVFFVSQHPRDINEDVLAQLGNRVQHALRGYTPKEKEAIKVAAKSFRQNPAIDAEEVITQLGVGEALVSVLDEKGIPSVVERVLISPPSSRIGPLKDEERAEKIARSPLNGVYANDVDRESAFEMIQEKRKIEKDLAEKAAIEMEAEKEMKAASKRQGPGEAFFKSILRSFGSQVGRRVAKGVLGTIMGKK